MPEQLKKVCKNCRFFKSNLGSSSPCPFTKMITSLEFVQNFNKKWDVAKDSCTKFSAVVLDD